MLTILLGYNHDAAIRRFHQPAPLDPIEQLRIPFDSTFDLNDVGQVENLARALGRVARGIDARIRDLQNGVDPKLATPSQVELAYRHD